MRRWKKSSEDSPAGCPAGGTSGKVEREKYNNRRLTYSRWHRRESIRRFLSDFEAWQLGMVDIDDVEYCRFCGEPLALIETAQDFGQRKSARVTARLAERAGIPAWLVFYTPGPDGDIVRFRVRQVYPSGDGEKIMSPREFAEFLVELRRRHKCRGNMEHPLKRGER